MASWVARWGLMLLVVVLVLASLACAEEAPEEDAKAAEATGEQKPEGEAAEAGAEGEKKEGEEAEKEKEKEKEKTVPLTPGEVMATTDLRSVLAKYTMFVVAVVNKEKQEGYKKFRGEFQSAAKVLKGVVQLVEVDGGSEEAKEIVEYMVPKKKGERAWPAISFFSSKPMWVTNKDSQPVPYKGNNTAVAITKWVHGKMTTRHVRRLRAKSEFDNEKLQNLQDKQPLVIMFHNDSIASPEYRALSINMWERASFFDARVNHNKTKRWMKSLRLSIMDEHLPVMIVAKPTGTITGDGNMGDIVIHGGKRLPKPKEEEKEEKKEAAKEGEEKKEDEEKKEEAKEKEEAPKPAEENTTEEEPDNENAEPAKFDYDTMEDVVDDHSLTEEQRDELLDKQEKEWEEEEARKKAEEEKRKQKKLEKERKEKEERRKIRSEFVAPFIDEAVKQQESDGEFIIIREEIPEAGLPLTDSEILREEWLI